MNIGLIFGMIVAIFMISLLLVFGFQQITSVSDLQERAEMQRAIKNLRSSVDRVYNLGGESSEKFTLTFPDSVIKVCFMPMYRGMQLSQKEARLRADIVYVLGASSQSYQTASLLVNQRVKNLPGTYGTDKADHNQTLLLFYEAVSVPEWFNVEHMGPTKEGGPYGRPLCVNGREQVWLQREFDENGAWVDVQEA